MSSNSIFPRKADLFRKDISDVREIIGRPSLDSFYQVTFSFGKWSNNAEGAGWLDGTDVSNSGGARVQGTDFMQKMKIMCAEAELPGTSYQTSLAIGHHQGIQEEFPNLRTFPPLDLVFYVDLDHVIIEVLETWMTYINPISTNKRDLNAFGRLRYPSEYKETLHITKYERDSIGFKGATGKAIPAQASSTTLTSYEFINVWPSNLTSMKVAYGDSNVLKCSVQFAYDRFFTKFDYTETNQSVEPSAFSRESLLNRGIIQDPSQIGAPDLSGSYSGLA